MTPRPQQQPAAMQGERAQASDSEIAHAERQANAGTNQSAARMDAQMQGGRPRASVGALEVRQSERAGVQRSSWASRRVARCLGAMVLVLVAAAGCRQDMHDQVKLEPLEESAFFKDKRASRQLVQGTIARGNLSEDVLLTTGRNGNSQSDVFPFPITAEVMERGRERYEIYCTPCHSRVGDGRGMIVMRGYKQPTSFHDDRLRNSPPGYFFGVITNGFATMPSYSLQVSVPDRWAIIAYIRALQLSQNASYDDLADEEKARLTSSEGGPGREGGSGSEGATEEHHGG